MSMIFDYITLFPYLFFRYISPDDSFLKPKVKEYFFSISFFQSTLFTFSPNRLSLPDD